MAASDTGSPSGGRTAGAADQNPYAAAEKLLAQWEARHAATASGRRIVGPGVSEYLSHERCTEACSSAGHKRHHGEEERAKARKQHRPPPDLHPHFSDLLAWMLPVNGSSDDPPDRPRGHRR